MSSQPLRMAIIGLGGFAGAHHEAAYALEKQGECRVVCACDPYPDAFLDARERWQFAARGIEVYTDYLQMLEAHQDELDLVTVPTPVPLHTPMHRACVERGLACYLEKPPTLDYAELNEMLAVETRAKQQTVVGFNFIYEPERHAMKARILNGDFGPVRSIRYLGMAARPKSYFTRSAWAGCLMMDGRLVLDAVIGNAVSHYIHNLLFWAGQEEILSWERVMSVEAELYRAHAIEGMDTVFARGECGNGIVMQVAATHACEGDQLNTEWIECERATIRHTTWEPYYIEWKDGRQESVPVEARDLLKANLLAYISYLHGESPRPLSRLVDTRPFVEFYDLAYIAAQRITQVAEAHISRSQIQGGDDGTVAILGIRNACDTFLANGRFPSEQGLAWARPGDKASIEEIGRLRSVVETMCAANEPS